MTTAAGVIELVILPDDNISVLALEGGKTRSINGKFRGKDINRKTIIIETDAGIKKEINTENLTHIKLDDDFVQNAFMTAKFASYFDEHGHQQWVQGSGPAPNPKPKPTETPQPAPTTPKPPDTHTTDFLHEITLEHEYIIGIGFRRAPTSETDLNGALILFVRPINS